MSEPKATPAATLGGSFPELERCLAEAGYTPPLRALARLVEALCELPEESVSALERALARAGAPALQAALAALVTATSAARPRLLSLLVRGAEKAPPGDVPPGGAVSADPLLPAFLVALDEPRAESRKLAARGLAKLGDARAEERLLAALEAADGSERKAIVDALGALGGAASRERLGQLASEDADLARRRERARLMIERRLGRGAGGLRLDVPLEHGVRVALSCRAGLAGMLAAELEGRFRPQVCGATRVEVWHSGTLGELLAARTALDVALLFGLAPPDGAPPEQRIAAALAAPECVEALGRWSVGVPRFRVQWLGAGHRRALSWALARALRERTTALVNDPAQATWTLRAAPDGSGELALVPRFALDPRFDYRRADVPAASHPTLAAALARFAGVAADEVVWDPFVGSGLELIERARLGPVRELWGSDIDARALEAARQNLEAAGLSGARLVSGDALTFAPPEPSLIITNPPMGRRVARDGSLGALLDGFLEHAARVLRPGGRLVWLSPLGERTERRGRELGFEVGGGPDVDMGGFTARLQRLTRRR